MPKKLTHCISEHGRKQMLGCQAKYTQTPYQFMNIMHLVGRLSMLASRDPLNVPWHVKSCMEPVCAWQGRLFKRDGTETCSQ